MSLIKVANMELIYCSVRSSGKSGGGGVKGWMGGIIILARCEFHFIGERKIWNNIEVKVPISLLQQNLTNVLIKLIFCRICWMKEKTST